MNVLHVLYKVMQCGLGKTRGPSLKSTIWVQNTGFWQEGMHFVVCFSF